MGGSAATPGEAAGEGAEGASNGDVDIVGHDPAERVSVTKIVAVRLSRPAASAAASCVLRVDVVAGGAGGTRFVLSDLITGSAEPGPLTWAFDVAGQLLLH